MPYQHLNARERMCILYLKQSGLSLRAIGRELCRSHTSISRELSRNKSPFDDYCDKAAEQLSNTRKAIPRHVKRFHYQKLENYIKTKLQLGWSPDIIANRIKRDYPKNLKMRVSYEAIYQWIFRNAEDGGDLYQYLVRHHKKRRKQRRHKGLVSKIPGRVDISKRPKIIDKKSRYGDWEGDTVVGHRHQGRLVTHVERKSRFLLAGGTTDGTADSFNEMSVLLFKDIPRQYLKTLTLDNGSENAQFKQLEEFFDMPTYFAKPYASWERGCNENTNGLLRRYFPKGTNFLSITDGALEKVVKILNDRPRKCLNYRTPFEVFNSVLGGALRT